MMAGQSVNHLLKAVLILLILFSQQSLTDEKKKRSNNLQKQSAISLLDTVRLGVNRIDIPLNNDSNMGGSGSTWYPSGQTGLGILFSGGFCATGYVNGELRSAWMAPSARINELQPGPLNSNPDEPRNRFYRVRATDGLGSPPYIEWSNAVAMGAGFEDVDGDGLYDPYTDTPGLLGDEMVWCVYNDQRSGNGDLGSPALDLEVRQLAWAFHRDNFLDNVIFIRYEIINRSGNNIDSLIAGVFHDADIGDFNDDLAGCDTTLDISYIYNYQQDHRYGNQPPAAGLQVLQGGLVASPGDTAFIYRSTTSGLDTIVDARTTGMTAFTPWTASNPDFRAPETVSGARHYQEGGRFLDGQPILPSQWGTGGNSDDDPRFFFSGNPVTGTGWRDNTPSDKYFLISSGPFQLNSGESQHIIYGYTVGQGNTPLESVEQLKAYATSLIERFRAAPGLDIVAPSEAIPINFPTTFKAISTAVAFGASITQFHWQLLEKPAGSTAVLSGGIEDTTSLVPDIEGNYRISATASYRSGLTISDTISIAATGNLPPVPALVITPEPPIVGEPFMLDASASSDPDNDPLNFQWEFPGWFTVNPPDSPQVRIATPYHSGSAAITLTVSDSFFVRRLSQTVDIEAQTAGIINSFGPHLPATLTGIRDIALYWEGSNSNFDRLFVLNDDQHLYVFHPNDLDNPVETINIDADRVDWKTPFLLVYRAGRSNLPNGVAIYEYDFAGGLFFRSFINSNILKVEDNISNPEVNFPYLFLPESPNKLSVYDISSFPATLVAEHPLLTIARDIEIDYPSAILYSTRPNIGIVSYDLSNPLQITTLDSLPVTPNQGLRKITFQHSGRAFLVRQVDQSAAEVTVVNAGDLASLQIDTVFNYQRVLPESDMRVLQSWHSLNFFGMNTTEGLVVYRTDLKRIGEPELYRYSGFPVHGAARNLRDLFIGVVDDDGFDGGLHRLQIDPLLEIGDRDGLPAKGFQLFANYPNPFNPETKIRYQISDIKFVNLTIFDILGRQVRTLVEAKQQPGSYTISWDGRNEIGELAASGIYIFRLQAGEFSASRKMLLVR